MTKCKNWKRYKGRLKPKCNNGKGCAYCNDLYSMLKDSNMFLQFIDKTAKEVAKWPSWMKGKPDPKRI